MPMLDVELYLSSPRYRKPAHKLPEVVSSAAKLLGRRCTLVHLSVAVVGNKRMSNLHKLHMGIDGPTDVLTFPLDADPRGRLRSGEVVICVPYAERTAKAHNVPLWKELTLYAVHGLLHLSGYDDLSPTEHRRMHKKEDQLLTSLGLGPVFHPQSRPGRS